MKLATIPLVILLLYVSSAAYGQITLKEKNASLDKVLLAIEKQTRYVFLYDAGEWKAGPITIHVKNATLQDVLAKCFAGQPMVFTVVGNNVLLKREEQVAAPDVSEVKVRGRVVDESGQPLMGVTVMNRRRYNGTETDSSGAFVITGRKGDEVSFSFVGFRDQRVRIGDRAYVNVLLAVNPASPDQVVVIGYGSSKKKDLTGAVSTVGVRELGEVPYNTFDNALAGKTAGVEVTKTDGTPGGMVRVRIRGSSSFLGGNDPLYVIDGVPVQVRYNFIDPGFAVPSPNGNLAGNGSGSGVALSASFINSLNSLGGVNPEDIESISVLKDASATAIYGSKAANGVVMITTKSGIVNSPARVAVDYSTTVNSLFRSPKLLNKEQFMMLLREAARNGMDTYKSQGITSYSSLSTIVDSPNYFGTANVDWVRQVTHTTVSNNAGVSVSGGGHASRYFNSFSYTSTPGVLRGTNYQRFTAKLNLETSVGARVKISSNLLAGFVNQDVSNGAYMQAMLARPDIQPRDSTGRYANFNALGASIRGLVNPAALVTATNNGKTLSLLGTLSGTYDLTRRLRFRTAVSLNLQHYNQRNYLPSYIDQAKGGNNSPNTGGIGSEANSRFMDWFLENTLSYNQQFNKHGVNVVAGQSYETTKYSWFRTTASGYPNDNFLNGLSSASTVVGVAGDEPRSPQSYLLSFYLRTNYSFMDKYLLTFTGRADGSSKFGPNNKYGYFPSGAVAWRVSRESFLRRVRWINDIKLRGSYGLVGNQNIGDQLYRALYNTVSYTGGTALLPVQMGNASVRWERTKEAGAGADVSLLDNRLNATFDYYNRNTDHALLKLPISVSNSFPSLLQNVAGLRSRGYEASIGGDIIRSRDFKWTVSINVTWNKTIVTRLDSIADLSQITSPSGIEANPVNSIRPQLTILKKGQSLGVMAGNYITGVIKTQADIDAYSKLIGIYARFYPPLLGDPMYRIDSDPASSNYLGPLKNQIIGVGPPKYYGGMTQEFSYKNWGLDLFFAFSHGGHLLWAQHVAATQFFGPFNAPVSIFGRYTAGQTNGNQPRLDLTSVNYTATNLDVFSSSYFKLRTATINYRFGEALWMKKAGVSGMRLFMSATNIFIITKYPGSDPEVSDDPYFVGGGYVDAANYPILRTFTFGLKAIF
ncbi:MAG: SusC/RagA family TonB-linked outer membrane protein [Bacteroidetes bacterium]|nr:SusC/RagA family TonB-linked outer membrane protein [Bacteroidota bacterium]